MRCEQRFCIYNDEDECLLDEIEVNVIGMCDSFILVPISKKTLKTAKNQLLSEFQEQESNW